MIMGRKRNMVRGRKTEFKDEYHRIMRERQREYTEKNREVLKLAGRERISVGEARKRLGLPESTRHHGKRKWSKKT